MEMKSFENIQEWLDAATAAQLLFQGDVLVAVNAAAKKMLPDVTPSHSVEEVFDSEAESYRMFTGKGTMAFPVKIGDVSLEARLLTWQGYTLAELRESMDALSVSALRSVSEGLLGPMTTVMSLTPKLLPQLEETSDLKNMERAAMVNQGLYAMFRAVNNIRFTAAEQLNVHTKRVNITGWLRELTGQLDSMCRLAERELVVELPERDYMCDVDADLMQRGLLNLVSNAMKFTEAGGQIRLSLTRMGDRIRICVQDNGCGIPAHQMGVVFHQKEHRAQSPDPRQGIGLGLAMTRRILQAHGGALLLESQEGKGTAAHMMLPMYQGKTPLTLSTTFQRPDYSGGFNKLLLELADALPSGAFDTRGIDL